jgi:hypothetical protein
MTLKLALTTLALVLAPVIASAECGHGDRLQSTSQCAAGQSWDTITQACVPVTSS